ncbi:MAG TPA: dockerin type I domain-containing protein, partial [Lacipirellulaceae bacterium]|nr:dockerin type I domain-containing protein [Lacipirellulaceae bacterium]
AVGGGGFDNLRISTLQAAPATNADFNGDGLVDGQDFLIWQRGLGLAGQTSNANGDANGDMVVDAADLLVWQAAYGGPPATAAAAAVPEPQALALAVAALGWAARRRRNAAK